jgi:hypothetical protein
MPRRLARRRCLGTAVHVSGTAGFYEDANSPEVSIGVREDALGQGVGRTLIEVLI